MSVISLFDTEKSSDLESLIAVCKSDSQIHGLQLREAHYKLGNIIAKRMFNDLPNHNITVIIMMRAGLCFGLGIADGLETLGAKVSILFYSDEEQWNKEKINCPMALANDLILVDAVINTGDSIIQFAQSIQNDKTIFFASNVLSEKAAYKFKDKCLYTTRVSENSFKGTKISVVKNGKGPDTGNRLFTQYEFILK
jgi:uracil phosphoribosyltransferase